MPTTQLPPSLVAALRASGAGESAGSVREWIEQGGKGRGDNGLGQVLSAIDALWHGSPCALPSSSRTEGGRHLRQNSGRSCSLGTANVTQPAQVAVGSGSERPMAVNLPHGGATVAHCAAAATAERRAAAAAARVKATEVDRSNALIDPLLATGPGTDDGADDGGLRGALRGLRSVEARLSSLRAWQTTSSTQRSPFNISEQDLASPTASDLFRTRESCAGTEPALLHTAGNRGQRACERAPIRRREDGHETRRGSGAFRVVIGGDTRAGGFNHNARVMRRHGAAIAVPLLPEHVGE